MVVFFCDGKGRKERGMRGRRGRRRRRRRRDGGATSIRVWGCQKR